MDHLEYEARLDLPPTQQARSDVVEGLAPRKAPPLREDLAD